VSLDWDVVFTDDVSLQTRCLTHLTVVCRHAEKWKRLDRFLGAAWK